MLNRLYYCNGVLAGLPKVTTDDFTLIVPENTDVSAEDEMRNVLLWSDDNVGYRQSNFIILLVISCFY